MGSKPEHSVWPCHCKKNFSLVLPKSPARACKNAVLTIRSAYARRWSFFRRTAMPSRAVGWCGKRHSTIRFVARLIRAGREGTRKVGGLSSSRHRELISPSVGASVMGRDFAPGDPSQLLSQRFCTDSHPNSCHLKSGASFSMFRFVSRRLSMHALTATSSSFLLWGVNGSVTPTRENGQHSGSAGWG